MSFFAQDLQMRYPPLKMLQTEVQLLKILYERFGPLGVASRLFGQFPVRATLSSDTLTIKFSVLSLATFFNIFFSIVPFTVYVANANLVSYFAWPNLIYQSILVPSTCVASLIGWSDVCALLHQLDRYDSHIHRVPVLTKRVSKFERGFVWIIAPPVQFVLLIWRRSILPDVNYATVFAMSIYRSPEMLQCMLYFFFCNEIFCRILQLHTSWLKYVQVNCTVFRLLIKANLHTSNFTNDFL